jgi:hypothetical protein
MKRGRWWLKWFCTLVTLGLVTLWISSLFQTHSTLLKKGVASVVMVCCVNGGLVATTLDCGTTMFQSAVISDANNLSIVVPRFWEADDWETLYALGFHLPKYQTFPDAKPAWNSVAQTSHIILPLWMPVLLFGLLSFNFWQTDRRRRGVVCRCGYDLTGNVSGRCPECGDSVTPGVHRTGQESVLAVHDAVDSEDH